MKPDQSQQKSQLRRQLREARRQLTSIQQTNAQHSLKQVLAASQEFQSANDLAFYLASDGEISPASIIELAIEQKKRCFLPVITKHKHLLFRQYYPGDKLIANRFGILEPDQTAIELDPMEFDIVFMPLVGFDEHGHRLGMGGGFYDRTFSSVCASSATKPHLIGLAHECQKCSRLPTESWDIPIAAVATDKKLYRF